MPQVRGQTGHTPRRAQESKYTGDRPCQTGATIARMKFACAAARRQAVVVRSSGYC
jgi:hypothetical protein